jgi:hypothetical protein
LAVFAPYSSDLCASLMSVSENVWRAVSTAARRSAFAILRLDSITSPNTFLAASLSFA